MTKVNDSKPAKQFAAVTQAGLKAYELLQAHAAELTVRLAPAIGDGLHTDLASMGALVPGATQTRAEARAATATQAQALASAYGFVTAIRTAVKRAELPAATRKAFGVGAKVNPRAVKHVVASGQQILAAAAKDAEATRAAGILAADLEALRLALESVQAADRTQEEKRAAAPTTTAERNRAARRVLAAVDRIAAAGILQFATDAVVRARFEALLGTGNPRRRKPATPAPN
jgi:hypothetical protein